MPFLSQLSRRLRWWLSFLALTVLIVLFGYFRYTSQTIRFTRQFITDIPTEQLFAVANGVVGYQDPGEANIRMKTPAKAGYLVRYNWSGREVWRTVLPPSSASNSYREVSVGVSPSGRLIAMVDFWFNRRQTQLMCWRDGKPCPPLPIPPSGNGVEVKVLDDDRVLVVANIQSQKQLLLYQGDHMVASGNVPDPPPQIKPGDSWCGKWILAPDASACCVATQPSYDMATVAIPPPFTGTFYTLQVIGKQIIPTRRAQFTLGMSPTTLRSDNMLAFTSGVALDSAGRRFDKQGITQYGPSDFPILDPGWISDSCIITRSNIVSTVATEQSWSAPVPANVQTQAPWLSANGRFLLLREHRSAFDSGPLKRLRPLLPKRNRGLGEHDQWTLYENPGRFRARLPLLNEKYGFPISSPLGIHVKALGKEHAIETCLLAPDGHHLWLLAAKSNSEETNRTWLIYRW